jgi:hypothetical protein
MEAKITALVEQFTTEKLPLAISVRVAAIKCDLPTASERP